MQVVGTTKVVLSSTPLSFTETAPQIKLQFGPITDMSGVGLHTFTVTATLKDHQKLDAIMAVKS